MRVLVGQRSQQEELKDRLAERRLRRKQRPHKPAQERTVSDEQIYRVENAIELMVQEQERQIEAKAEQYKSEQAPLAPFESSHPDFQLYEIYWGENAPPKMHELAPAISGAI